MWMIAGLGNPGREYAETRHNIGFRVVERLAERAAVRWSDKKFKARLGRGRIGDAEIICITPQTYMNLSGESVGPALGFYKLRTDQLIVVHDDLDLPFDDVTVKRGGGHRGHNGLRSLKQHLPDDGFIRVRVGIGRPPARWDPADYVLAAFSSSERSSVDGLIDRAAELVEATVVDGAGHPPSTELRNGARSVSGAPSTGSSRRRGTGRAAR